MYSLAEYIIISRSIQVLYLKRLIKSELIRWRSLSDRELEPISRKEYVNMQHNLFKVLSLYFTGLQITRYVSVEEEENLSRIEQIPIYLVKGNIEETEYTIPMAILLDMVIGINPADGSIIDILPTEALDSSNINEETINELIKDVHSSDNSSDIITFHSVIRRLASGQFYIKELFRLFKEYDASNYDSVSPDSELFKKIMEHSNIKISSQVHEDLNNNDETIKITDFMPIALNKSEKLITVLLVNKNTGVVSYISDEYLKDTDAKNVIIVRNSPGSCKKVIYRFPDSLYYSGLNKVSYVENGKIISTYDFIKSCIDPSNSEDNNAVGCESVYIPQWSFANEGIESDTIAALKKGGIYTTSGLIKAVKFIASLPTGAAKMILGDIASLLKSSNSEIRDHKEKYKEKALNDEIHRVADKLANYRRSLIKAIPATALFIATGPFVMIIFIPVFFKVKQWDSEKRRDALKMLEHEFRTEIDIYDDKINRANSESDYEQMADLKREKAYIEAQLGQLVKLRVDNHNDSFINRALPKKYSAFNPMKYIKKNTLDNRLYDEDE